MSRYLPLFLAVSVLAISSVASVAMSTKAVADAPAAMPSLSAGDLLRGNIAFPLAVITVKGIALTATNPSNTGTRPGKRISPTAF